MLMMTVTKNDANDDDDDTNDNDDSYDDYDDDLLCDVQIDASMRSLTDAMTLLDVSLAAETNRYIVVCVFVFSPVI